MSHTRNIKEIIEPKFAMEGAGVLLRRSISPHASNKYDPFLLFDHFAFNDPKSGPIAGFPMHPHRGIETVTYMLEGRTRHRDSLGNTGEIGPGDVQWMTSGRGIMHEEMPQRSESGNNFGFQLWLNLPAKLKMTSPRYQDVSSSKIPTVQRDGVSVRIVAGEFDKVGGPVHEISAAPLYMEVQMRPGAEFVQAVPMGHTVLAYLFEGSAVVGTRQVDAVRLINFGDGDEVCVRTQGVPARFMLIAGKPFGEPIAPYGPFVMNTRDEIQQALQELRDGTFIQSE